MIALVFMCLALAPDPFGPPVKGTVMPNGHVVGACEFLEGCIWNGSCDGTPDCVVRRPATAEGCLYSRTCVEQGYCTWNTSWSACGFAGPDACSSERGACRINGRCKAAERGTSDPLDQHCQATREGCATSESCSLDGLCGPPKKGGFLCRASRRSCRESLNCKRYGLCTVTPDGSLCMADERSCRASEACKEFGMCEARGPRDFMTCSGENEPENLRPSRECTVYGYCSLGSRPCAYRGGAGCYTKVPASMWPKDCEQSALCERFGACHTAHHRCWVVPEFPACELERIPNVKVTASSVHAPWDIYDFNPANLVDGIPKTVWQAGVEGDGPHYLTFSFEAPVAVAGLEFANAFQHVNPRWGVLASRFASVRGYAVLVPRNKTAKYAHKRRNADLEGYIVHEAFRSGEGYAIYTQPFEPVVTDRIVVQLFENQGGHTANFTSISELAPLRCKAPMPAE